MYIPKGFEVEDLATLHGFMEEHSFAVLTGTLEGAPFATHLPLLIDRERGAKGTIVGHIARANATAKSSTARPRPLPSSPARTPTFRRAGTPPRTWCRPGSIRPSTPTAGRR